jgi:hypothetical protein
LSNDCDLTVAEDLAGLEPRVAGVGAPGHARGPLVHVEEVAHAVPGAVRVVQPHVPQRLAREAVQHVALGNKRLQVRFSEGFGTEELLCSYE